MTPSELVAVVRSLGCELLVREGELRVRKPIPAPPELDFILSLVRQDREAVKAALEPVCIDCRQPVTPNNLFCDGCFQARKVVPLEELARRREERRSRACLPARRTS